MLEIIICDDRVNHNEFIKHVVKNTLAACNLQDKGRIALVTEAASDVIHFSQTNKERCLYILDIRLEGEMGGIELAEEIRKSDPVSYIVYITAHSEYSIQGYRTKTFDYLLKPLNEDMIRKMLLRVFDDVERLQSQKAVFSFPVGSVIHHIPVGEIAYLEKKRNILHIHTQNNCYSGYMSLKRADEILPDDFVICEKSHIVSLTRIRRLDKANKEILLEDGTKIPVSRHYMPSVLQALEDCHAD